MRVIQRGHKYALDNRGEATQSFIQYVNLEPGQESPGTTQQELIRMMLDRNRYCNNCLPHPNNARIQYHLRMVLALHEGRALERKAAKGQSIEYADVGPDGHLFLRTTEPFNDQHTFVLDSPEPIEGTPKHSSGT